MIEDDWTRAQRALQAEDRWFLTMEPVRSLFFWHVLGRIKKRDEAITAHLGRVAPMTMIDRREVPLFCLYHLHMTFEEIADMDENCRCRRDYRDAFLDHYMRIWHYQFEKKGLAAGRNPNRTGYVPYDRQPNPRDS